jgi:1-deoxyxylulose-5-phosphate synthase
VEFAHVGSSGLSVSRICLGCMSFGDASSEYHRWTLDEDASRSVIKHALDAGINFFDTANVYSGGASEEITGRALMSMARREDVVIATKVGWPHGTNASGLSRREILHHVDASLRRLGTDYIDLYQIHRADRRTPWEETLEALHDVVKAGKVRYLGASSMYAWEFSKALFLAEQHGWTRFISMQNHYNVLYREEERDMVPLCEDRGVGLIPWSPLARGRAARPWDAVTHRSQVDPSANTRYHEDSTREVVDRIGAVADARGVPRAQVALAWLLMQPAVTAPIVGVTKLTQLDDAVAAVDLRLTDEEVACLEEPYRPQQVAGIEATPPGEKAR